MDKFHTVRQFRCLLAEPQHRALDRVLKECCDLYNALRLHRMYEYQYQGKSTSKFEQMKQFTQARKGDPFWDEVAVQVARGVIKQLDHSYSGFFRRVKAGESPGYPKFRKYRDYNCISLGDVKSGNFRVSKSGGFGYVVIKGLPIVKVKLDRKGLPPVGSLKTLRLVRTPLGWDLNLGYEFTPENYPVANRERVGIDLGVNSRLALSDGTFVDGRIPDRTKENKLRRELERRTKRGPKGRMSRNQSKRRRKTQKALAREAYRNKIRNRNFCHQMTTGLVRKYGRIATEALLIVNMVKSAKGTVEAPGKNVEAKSSLNRRILEQTWGLILYMLTYKTQWAGGEHVKVNPAFTSRTCGNCSRRSPQREYRVYFCEYCEEPYDRDTNAAVNIENRGFPDEEPRKVPPLAEAKA